LVELIAEGKNGFFFEPGNVESIAAAIDQLRQSTTLQIPENQYTEEFHLTQLEQLYGRYAQNG
jgi:glycosyltransferase involved in cell wall biosynthesis